MRYLQVSRINFGDRHVQLLASATKTTIAINKYRGNTYNIEYT